MSKTLRILAIIVLVLTPLAYSLPSAKAIADTCTWTGAVNSNWSNGGNWSGCDNGGVPESGDTLTFPTSASNKTNTNDIVGLNLEKIIFEGQDYNVTGNSVSISPTTSTVMQFINTSGNNDFGLDVTINGSAVSISQDEGPGLNTISGNLTFNLSSDMNFYNYDNSSFIISGDRSGNSTNVNYYGNIILSGTGTNTYTGAINVLNATGRTNPAAFTVNSSGALGAGNPAVNVSSTSSSEVSLNLFAAGTYANNIILSGSSFTPAINSNGAVTISGEVTVNSGLSLIKPQSGSLTLAGALNVNQNLLIEISPGAEITKSGIDQITIADNKAININGLGVFPLAANFNSNIIGASSTSITSSGNALLQMNGNNSSFNGTITANSGSALQPTSANALGSTVGGTTINNGAALILTTNDTHNENITLSGSGVAGSSYNGAISVSNSSPELSGTITLAGDTTFAMEDNDSSGDEFTLGGVITGSGNLTLLRNQGSNATRYNFLQTSPNTYSGKTIVEGASLELNGGAQTIPNDLDINSTPTQSAIVGLASDNDIADDSVITLNDDATPGTFSTFRLFSTMFNETIGTLNGNGTVCFDNSSQTLSVGGGNTSGSFNGFLCSTGTGVGTISKLGSGNWELASGADYESATNGPQLLIEGGSIAVNANLPATTIDVDGGGTLKGTGTTGNVTLNSAGNINAGNSPGCITVGDLNMTNSSVFTQEIAGSDACSGYDRVSTSSSAQLGNATLNVVPSYQPTVGTVFTIVQADSINGIFSGLPNGAKFTSNGLEFQINYSETQVTLTFLSGTLASTGQNSNQIAIIAMSILILSLVGLGIERLTRKPIKINA